jgi:hypothetical protein
MDGAIRQRLISRVRMAVALPPDWEVMIEYVTRLHGVS